MIDKRHLFQNVDTGNLVNEIQSQLFKRAPTAKVIQEPKQLTSTEEVDQHVSDDWGLFCGEHTRKFSWRKNSIFFRKLKENYIRSLDFSTSERL